MTAHILGSIERAENIGPAIANIQRDFRDISSFQEASRTHCGQNTFPRPVRVERAFGLKCDCTRLCGRSPSERESRMCFEKLHVYLKKSNT